MRGTPSLIRESGDQPRFEMELTSDMIAPSRSSRQVTCPDLSAKDERGALVFHSLTSQRYTGGYPFLDGALSIRKQVGGKEVDQ